MNTLRTLRITAIGLGSLLLIACSRPMYTDGYYSDTRITTTKVYRYPTYDHYPCRLYHRTYVKSGGYWLYNQGFKPYAHFPDSYYRRYLC